MPSHQMDTPPRPRRAPPPPTLDLTLMRTQAGAAWREGEALGAAGDIKGARARLERAHRLAPSDQNLLFSVATMRLRDGDALAALAAYEKIARKHGIREAWAGVASAALAAGQIGLAMQATQAALSRNEANAVLAALAGPIAQAAGLPGWCGLGFDGALLGNLQHARVKMFLDGEPVEEIRWRQGKPYLFDGWETAEWLEVRSGGVELLGSPVNISAIRRLEGFVTRRGGKITGWAWHPGAPEIEPALRVLDAAGQEITRLKARDASVEVEGNAPLARPRGFSVASPGEGPIRVVGADGRDLLGSPLAGADDAIPPLPSRIAGTNRRSGKRVPARPTSPPHVVIPVYRGLQTSLACIASVIATVPASSRIWVVNDGTPEAGLRAALERLAAEGRVILINSAPDGGNHGFPTAANAGLQAAAGHDVAVLNSDTLVPPGWLETLADAAYSAPDIGTVTPLSNEASILSYPRREGANPAPDAPGMAALSALAQTANAGLLVDIPTAHGFCMFIRQDCLAATGMLRDDIFAQGYGEENDFSERARALGWRHVAVPEVFVAHVGGVSFGAARGELLARNLRMIDRLHPDYLARVHAHIAADPLAPARRRLDAARWREGRSTKGAVLIITHGAGGGTARIVAERARAARDAGLRPIILSASEALCDIGDGEGAYPNLRYDLPDELPALAELLQADHPIRAELHHLLGHDHSIVDLFAQRAIPYEVWVHDYAWFCARICLVTGDDRYCGEPDVAGCEACITRWGHKLDEPIAPTQLVARSTADLRAADAVIVPSNDVARRMRRHFPAIAPTIRPWEAPRPFQAIAAPQTGRRRVAVVGAIGLEKGFSTLLACAQNAATRALALEFIVVGYTIDDPALEATGHARVIGAFEPEEAVALIRAQQAQLAFLPSIWPETWCYALSDAWAAGLPVALFDLGTPAERVRASGNGWVLPLGLPPASINDMLLRCQVSLGVTL